MATTKERTASIYAHRKSGAIWLCTDLEKQERTFKLVLEMNDGSFSHEFFETEEAALATLAKLIIPEVCS